LAFVAFFLEVGLLLVVLPWSPFWEKNYFAEAWPAFLPVLTNDFVRGAVSGLGLVNLIAGFVDLSGILAARPQRDATLDETAGRSS
jgi:polyferredoxin